MGSTTLTNRLAFNSRILRPICLAVTALALALSSLSLSPSAASADGNTISVTGLQANGRVKPLGIAGDDQSLSWKSESTARGVTQSAYEVRVARSGDALGDDDVWSSGKVESPKQLNVAYGGPKLDSQARYFWQVRVWDGADNASDWSTASWFETGILTADEWSADWVGKPEGGEIDRWTNYTTDIDFTLDNLALGVYVRAKDTSNAYMWQISVSDGTGKPKFRPHKKVGGSFSLIESKDISSAITQEELLDGEHTMSIKVDGSTITTSIDGKQIDSRTDATFAKGFIGFRQSLATEGPETATIHGVKVTALDNDGGAGDVLFETDFSDGTNPFTGGNLTSDGLVVERNLDAILRTSDDNKPLLRKEFATEEGKTIAKARVYASAKGTYELQLNGDKVGDQFLSPGWTDYRTRIQYQTYDVTDMLNNGQNAIGAELGDGWWAGKVGMWGPGVYGNDLAVIAQMRIDYTDGSHQTIKTDDSWKSHTGPFVEADNIDGETYDARVEQPGWDNPNYDDAGWHKAKVAAPTTAKLVPQPDEPVRVTGERPAEKRTMPAPNTHVYDLGQNMVGVAKMRIQGAAGSTVKIRYGEELRQDGSLYVGNLRAAKVTDHYTFKSTGTVVYEPKFTQHGFRFIEISGTTVAPELGDVTGVVWGSDLTATGTLETSNSMLNKLQSNISWGQRGNFLSIPTDTPARDERLGWTGDINVFAPTASYLRDTRAFLGKWTTDLRDAQQPNGDFPGVAPLPPGINLGGNLGWADSAITVPYAVWHAQADNDIVRANYTAMKKFLTFVKTSAGADLIDSDRSGYNDWLNLDDDTPAAVLGTAYFAEDARMMSEMAESIGEDADAAEFATLSDNVRAAFADKFVAADGAVTSNSQTAYAMALGMNLVPEDLREKVGDKYVAKLKASDNHLTTGFLGTPWLLPALSSIGQSELAYTMILKKDYPSWGYEIEHGATTMWERWNSIKPDGSFGDEGMNSFNHYAYGAVGDWMYQNIGGISALKAGYKKSRIAPELGGGLTSGHGTYESVYGTISSKWTKSEGGLSLNVKVPVNTTSEVSVPADNVWAVTEGSKPLADAEGVSDITFKDGVVTFTVGSGSYAFDVDAQRSQIGLIIEEIEKVDAHVDDLATAGDLSAEHRTFIGDALSNAKADVSKALAGDLEGDAGQVSQHLSEGLAAIRSLKVWVGESSIDGPVRGDLTTRLGKIEDLFGKSIASSLGVSVVIPPVAADSLPGDEVAGTIEVANTGGGALSDLKAEVKVEDWKIDPATLEKNTLAAGDSAQLPFTVTVPKHQKPGTYDASVALTFTSPGGTFTLKDATAWVTVSSGLEITGVESHHPVDDSEERAGLDVSVRNDGKSAVTGQIHTTVPEGWKTPALSNTTTIDSGETKVIKVPVFVPIDVVNGKNVVTVDFVSDGTTLASKNADLGVDLPVPPTRTLDYVDFGESGSETAHTLQSGPHSGTNTEAGLTRRYAHSSHPGSWYSAEVQVEAGKSFILRARETFDGARTKKYNIYVDDTLVEDYMLKRTETGVGTKTYQVLVDDPGAIDNDGTVRIKFEYPTDASSYFDPSIADLWVLPATEDNLAPDASASVSSSTAPGDNGWYRGNASVTVKAVDNRDDALVVEVGESSGWQPYVGPVGFTGDGKHSLSYRAKDAAGNSTGERKIPVWIDGTAPSTQLAIAPKAGAENSDKATLKFTAQDASSGVMSTTYRVDGGAWKVLGDTAPEIEGYGPHTVEFFTTDKAGNPEALRSVVVELADVAEIRSVAVPQIMGTASYGSTLTSTPGSWNTNGLTFDYQWLRDGKAISGAPAATYKLVKADLGHKIAVKVTAGKPGKKPVSATSAQTAKVVKASSSTVVGYSASSVKKGGKVTLTINVTSPTSTATGDVKIYVDGKRVASKSLSNEQATIGVSFKKKGTSSVKVVYAGNSVVEGSDAAKAYIKVN